MTNKDISARFRIAHNNLNQLLSFFRAELQMKNDEIFVLVNGMLTGLAVEDVYRSMNQISTRRNGEVDSALD